jgi:hypothetical protein
MCQTISAREAIDLIGDARLHLAVTGDVPGTDALLADAQRRIAGMSSVER